MAPPIDFYQNSVDQWNMMDSAEYESEIIEKN